MNQKISTVHEDFCLDNNDIWFIINVEINICKEIFLDNF